MLLMNIVTSKKFALPIVALAIMLPMAVLDINMSTDTKFELVCKTINPHTINDVGVIGKTLTIQIADETEFNFYQLADVTDFIIEYILLNSYAFEVKDLKVIYSDIFTNY